MASPAESYFAALEWEINRERAEVLGRYGRKVDAAIAKCNGLLDAVVGGDAYCRDEYRAARSSVLEAIDKLCLQREMLGVYDNARVHRLYPVPPRLEDLPQPAMGCPEDTAEPEFSPPQRSSPRGRFRPNWWAK